MSEEQIVAESASDPQVHSAPLPGPADETVVPVFGVRPDTGTAEPSQNPLGDLVTAHLEARLAQGAPTAQEAVQKYEARRRANADAFTAYVNGTGPNPFEGRRL